MAKNKSIFDIGSIPKARGQGVERVLPQTGKRASLPRDAARFARLPGKRVSRTGHVYWETRRNRSDAPQKNV